MTTASLTPAADLKELAVEQLQPLVVDLLALRLHAKQAHWNVRGPHFRDLHLELDEVAAELDAWIDEVAERLVALGAPVAGDAPAIVGADAPAFPSGFVADSAAAAALAGGFAAVAESARERVSQLEDDLATQDVVIGIVQGLEKRLWMLRSRLA